MPFYDTQEGKTHHGKDNCYKCIVCLEHFSSKDALHMHTCLTPKELLQKEYNNQTKIKRLIK